MNTGPTDMTDIIYDRTDEDDQDEEGCLYPDTCCMAAVIHNVSECYTPDEIMEDDND